MSMFTEVVHPHTKEHLQIKTGKDDFALYKIGDMVDWHKGEKPGVVYFGDGVYEAYGPSGDGIVAWVVVKGHKIYNVVDFKSARSSHLGQHDLEKLFEVEQVFERGWWSESEWAAQGVLDAEAKVKELQEEVIFLKTLIGKSDTEIKQIREARLGSLMSGFLVGEMRKESIAKQIFPVKHV